MTRIQRRCSKSSTKAPMSALIRSSRIGTAPLLSPTSNGRSRSGWSAKTSRTPSAQARRRRPTDNRGWQSSRFSRRRRPRCVSSATHDESDTSDTSKRCSRWRRQRHWREDHVVSALRAVTTAQTAHDIPATEIAVGDGGDSFFTDERWLGLIESVYGYRATRLTAHGANGERRGELLVCALSSPLTGRRIVSLPFSDVCPLMAH